LKKKFNLNLIDLLVSLLDGDFRARHGFAREAADAAFLEGDRAVLRGVDGEVAAERGAFAGALGEAGLADDHLAGFDLLAAIALDAKALPGRIMDIFGGTASFYV
jgi:hypothetical protein